MQKRDHMANFVSNRHCDNLLPALAVPWHPPGSRRSSQSPALQPVQCMHHAASLFSRLTKHGNTHRPLAMSSCALSPVSLQWTARSISVIDCWCGRSVGSVCVSLCVCVSGSGSWCTCAGEVRRLWYVPRSHTRETKCRFGQSELLIPAGRAIRRSS